MEKDCDYDQINKSSIKTHIFACSPRVLIVYSLLQRKQHRELYLVQWNSSSHINHFSTQVLDMIYWTLSSTYSSIAMSNPSGKQYRLVLQTQTHEQNKVSHGKLTAGRVTCGCLPAPSSSPSCQRSIFICEAHSPQLPKSSPLFELTSMKGPVPLSFFFFLM